MNHNDTQRDEFKYFQDHQEELINEFPDKFVVIKGQQVIGAYDTVTEAYLETNKSHDEGSYIIQMASREAQNNPQIFHSRIH